MAQGKTLIFPGLALIFVLIAVLPEISGDRSPYVPDPVTYPGLLPQFTSTTTPAPPGSAGSQHRPTTTRRPQGEERPKPSTTTTETAAGEDLGDRFGEERPENRPDGSSGGPQRPQTQRPQTQRPQTQRPTAQRPCEEPRVPCYDCIVYISRTGQITRFYPREAGGL
ncbi:translation initiation factor IF-2-like [Ischnura elegans]|uniref:translation initiation factor IF-2-like n=1 Tax=Ischnura elegans TaxID=197161 RepID=UPI001ED8B81A|nr:translation initiation factor IF-2-like [Ischnura elegans]